MSPADKPVRVGMLGCGVVGSQVARLLLSDTAELSTRAGVKIELTRIAVRTIKDYPGLNPSSVNIKINEQKPKIFGI